MSEVVNPRTGEVLETKTASAEDLRKFAVSVRDEIPDMPETQLDELEVYLIAVAKRLRQLGKDAAEAEASRVVAIRRLGELLPDAKKTQGERRDLSQKEEKYFSQNQEKLSHAQWNRRHQARLLARFSDFVDNEIRDGLAATPPKVSLSKLVKLCQRRKSLRDVPMPERRYSILYCDPPWQYEAAESGTRQIENQYGTMPLERIKALGEKIPAADDAVLFFWVTSPKLADGLAVLKAWEFEYRTCMVWVKDKIGMGYYARQQHELLLIAKRGSLPVPAPVNRPSSVFHGQRDEHSAKPETAYRLIESMYPEYERSDDSTDFCELFARDKREGWDPWGLDTAI